MVKLDQTSPTSLKLLISLFGAITQLYDCFPCKLILTDFLLVSSNRAEL